MSGLQGSDLPEVIVRLAADGRHECLKGQERLGDVLAAHGDMAVGKPGARRVGERVVILAPLADGVSYLFELARVPPVEQLAVSIKDLQELAQVIEGGRAGVEPHDASVSFTGDAGTEADIWAAISTSLNAMPARTAAGRKEALLDAVMRHNVANSLTVAQRLPKKKWRFYHHNRAHAQLNEEMRNLLNAAEEAEAFSLNSKADGENLEIDAALLKDRIGHIEELRIELPAKGAGDVAVFIGDPNGITTAQMPAVMQSLGGFLPASAPASIFRRMVAPLILLFVAAALFFPIPIRLPATGETIARSANVVALPSDAFLNEVLVSPGDFVEERQVLATFSAPQIEERIAQLQLTKTLEEVNGQDAMAQNNFAGFQAAEQRRLIAQTEIDALSERLASLQPKATAAGRIIEALPRGASGEFYPLGQAIATIQTSDTFDVLLSPSAVDATAISVGLLGSIQFRGLAKRSYDIEVLTPPTFDALASDGTRELRFRARITTNDQSELITGLAGFARIKTGTSPAGLVWGRYILEWGRLKAWTLFALQI